MLHPAWQGVSLIAMVVFHPEFPHGDYLPIPVLLLQAT